MNSLDIRFEAFYIVWTILSQERQEVVVQAIGPAMPRLNADAHIYYVLAKYSALSYNTNTVLVYAEQENRSDYAYIPRRSC